MRPIDADAFKEQYGNYYAEEGPEEGFIGTVGELIAKQPTIEAEPVRHGNWNYDCPNAIFVCSECLMMYRDNPNYCPRCGAKMDVGADK